MKKITLLLAVLLIAMSAQAQKYRDSLYNAFVQNYKYLTRSELEYNKALFMTGEAIFSIQHPAMRNAMKESKMEDSTAMSVLGRWVMDKFLNDEFIGMACDHYDKEYVKINQFYTGNLCERVEQRMNAAGKMPEDERAKYLEKALLECSAAMAKDKSFAEKATKVREEYGIDKILHITECNTPYMYVYCPYMHQYMVNAPVEKAVTRFVQWRKDEQMRMYASLKEYILSGEDAAMNEFVADKAQSELYKSMSAIRKRAKELKPGRNELMYRPVVTGNKTSVSYVYMSTQPEILGGIDMNVQWKDFKWSISKSSAVAEADVKDRQALLNIASMQKMPENKKVEEDE